jgi:hypothetical protein
MKFGFSKTKYLFTLGLLFLVIPAFGAAIGKHNKKL